MSELKGREILLGVTGGIACYKAVEVLRCLKRMEAEVSVVMTESAEEFVRPLTFQALSGRPVGTHLFDLDQESQIGHIRMAERAELVLVAPCTANFLAKLRAGLADDLLSTVLLATEAPIYLALAMNDRMLLNPATQENLEVLKSRGIKIIPPEVGFLAEGKNAVGRLAEPDKIAEVVKAHFLGEGLDDSSTNPLSSDAFKGKKVLVTAGPTVEKLDPVRFISNRSSGRMGYALAEMARNAGADVTLIRGPVTLPDLSGVRLIEVNTAEEMYGAVMENLTEQNFLFLAAAVADFRAKEVAGQKMKRAGKTTMTLELEANQDIAQGVGERKKDGQILTVFAAESENMEKNAELKLVSKNADMVVANNILEPDAGFDTLENRVTLITRRDNQPCPPVKLPLMSKHHCASEILLAALKLHSE